MNKSRTEQEIFLQALETESPEARAAFIQQSCADDPTLLAGVQGLLGRQSRVANFLESPAASLGLAAGGDICEPEKPGTLIGRYKLLEKIGEGGMGVVYMAEQEEPVRRRVALKIIKLGMDTKQVVARFEAERQALALMDHPHIAKVFDGGVTDNSAKSEIRNPKSEIQQGRPYFVMELVRGIPITRFCEENQLSINERLKLFIPVCHAIQHAHQKGIIHRDIKPSNVLVTLNEGVPHPMVIDFGVAKAIDQRLTEKTYFTRFTQMIGTPAYMSPEQAEMSKTDVDTRSDVYSLGILLYELLTGTTPFPEERLRKASYPEMQRIISEEEPLRPSTVLSRLNGHSRAIAANRQSEPATLIKHIKGDLDWIVLKAIEKDRNRRYATPNELAADIERFLNDEPILARPVTRLERVWRWCRRKPALAASLLLISILLLIVIIGSPIAAYRINQARQDEMAARTRAEVEASNALSILGFLKDDFLVLADPYRAAESQLDTDREMSLKAAVHQAGLRIGSRFGNQPLVEAEIRLTIGRAMERLGELDAARSQLEMSARLYREHAGADAPGALAAREVIAWVQFRNGEVKEAAASHRSILDRRREVLPPGSPEVFQSMNGLASALARAGTTNYPEVQALFERVIAEGSAALGETHAVVLSAKEGLSELLYETGLTDQSHRLDEEVFEARRKSLGVDHPDFLRSAADRCHHLRYRLGDFHAAEALGSELLERCHRVLGEEDPATLLMTVEHGMRLQARGLWYQSVESRQELVRFTRQRFRQDHARTLWAEDMLGGSLRFAGDFSESESVHRASIEARRRGGQNQTVAELRSQYYLAWAVFHQGRVAEAQQLYEDVIAQARDAHQGNNPRVIYHTKSLSALLGKQADWPGLVRLYLNYAPHDSISVHAAYPLGILPLPAGILATQLAGDESATRILLDLLMARHQGTTDITAARAIALGGLALPNGRLTAAESEELVRMARFVIAESPGRLDTVLLSGMLAYRIGEFDDAARHLGSLTRNPDHAVASTAGFIRAMALFRRGAQDEARRALALANQTLDIGLRPGLLGHRGQSDFRYDLRWAEYARSLALRDEAEKLVLGRVASPPVDRETLHSRLAAWQPIQALLEEAHQYGRRREWVAARDALVRAMERGPINWEEEGNFIPALHLKAASVLALTGDTNRYAALCAELLETAAASQPHFAWVALLAPDGPGYTSVALEIARWNAPQMNQTGRPIAGQEHAWLRLGVAEYRARNLAAASDALAKARDSFNLAAAGTASAFSALVAHANGQAAESRELLAQASSRHQELLAGNPERLSQDWHEVAILELALKEAGLSVGQVNK